MIVWYVLRTIAVKKAIFNLSTLFSILSLALGVATLMAGMSIVNGYERALKSSVFDAFGHLVVTNASLPIYDLESEMQKIQEVVTLPKGTHHSPFVHKEILAVNKGRLVGALIEGLDPESYQNVSGIGNRVTGGGGIRLEVVDQDNSAYIGKGLAQSLGVGIGDSFSIVLPFSDQDGQLRRKMKRLKVAGLLDLGQYDYNNRYILTDIVNARDFIGFSSLASTGIRFKFKNPEEADRVQRELMASDLSYLTQTWKATNSSLFEALKFERVVLFLVLSIMTVVAAFNLTTGLYLNVFKKTVDVSILRTLGLTAKQIYFIFTLQGLGIGLLGYFAGVILGAVLIGTLNLILASGLFLPPEVYQLNALVILPSALDLVFILIASLLICFVATLSPALKSVQLPPAEGLRYD
ncbi:MAG: ABC transporter permease [Bdellovibrionaceae bacterium]|nr:ABC transporter permease [Pseudobdellovibrionaceae bacterium]